MKEFIDKLISRLEESLSKAEQEMNYYKELSEKDSSCEVFADAHEKEYKAYFNAISIVNQLAEEYNNGWINDDVESPTENGKYIVYYRKWTDGNYLPKFDETEIRILRYRNNDWVFPTYGDTEAEKDIHREVLAWQPLPAPYQPKGE